MRAEPPPDRPGIWLPYRAVMVGVPAWWRVYGGWRVDGQHSADETENGRTGVQQQKSGADAGDRAGGADQRDDRVRRGVSEEDS